MNTDAAGAGAPLSKKLGIDDESVFTVLHAPPGFAAVIGDFGDAVWQRNLMPPIDVVLAFFTERAALVAEFDQFSDPAKPSGAVWIAWPKPTSGRRSDITDDTLRADLLRRGWVDNKSIAIDDVWNALRFVVRPPDRRGRRQ